MESKRKRDTVDTGHVVGFCVLHLFLWLFRRWRRSKCLLAPPLFSPPVVHSKSSNKWNVFLFFFPNIEYWSGLLRRILTPFPCDHPPLDTVENICQHAVPTVVGDYHFDIRCSFPPLSLSLSFPFSLHLPLLAFFSFCFSSLGCVCDLIYALLSVSLIVFVHKYGRAARKYLSICEIQSKPFCHCLCPCCCCSCFA